MTSALQPAKGPNKFGHLKKNVIHDEQSTASPSSTASASSSSTTTTFQSSHQGPPVQVRTLSQSSDEGNGKTKKNTTTKPPVTSNVATTTTPFHLAHRPRQITPPGVGSNDNIECSLDGRFANEVSSGLQLATTAAGAESVTGAGTSVADSTDSNKSEDSLLFTVNSPPVLERRQEEPLVDVNELTIKAEESIPSLSLDGIGSSESNDGSWDAAVLSFFASPLKKKGTTIYGKDSQSPSGIEEDGHLSRPRGGINDAQAQQVNSTSSTCSLEYDLWERTRQAGHDTCLPFVSTNERPSNMQKQSLLRLPTIDPETSLTDTNLSAHKPPTSVLTSPHMLYAWLRTRFAAGLVRSSFTVLHDMLKKDYQQAKSLLGKIHEDQPRSEGYISELLTLRDHLAGIWCVYAHFALDVGRLARTVEDDVPFPSPSNDNQHHETMNFVKDNSSTYGGTLRLQMINSPIRPCRKRKKSAKAVESEEHEGQLDLDDNDSADLASERQNTIDTLGDAGEDEYVPTESSSKSKSKAKRQKRSKKESGPVSEETKNNSSATKAARKNRPKSKSKAKASKGTEETTKKTGHWTKTEHERFLKGIALYGRGKWKSIAEVVQTRTTVQVKTHGQSYFRDDGAHHIQTIEDTPEQKKAVTKRQRQKNVPVGKTLDRLPSGCKKGHDGNQKGPRPEKPEKGVVLSYEDNEKNDDREHSDEGVPDITTSTPLMPASKCQLASPILSATRRTSPRAYSSIASPYMGTTSMSNLEDLVLGGGLFSPSEFSQNDRIPTISSSITPLGVSTPLVKTGRTWEAGSSSSSSFKDKYSAQRSNAIGTDKPTLPRLWDSFLDDLPSYMRGFFTSVGIVSVEKLTMTPTRTLAEIYMSYQRDQVDAVISSVTPPEAPKGYDSNNKSQSEKRKLGTYQDIVGFALSTLLAARKCPLVGNHHFIVLALGRMIVSTAPMEKTPDGESSVHVPTPILSSRINSAIAASWDGVKSCYGCGVDESKIFVQSTDSIQKATALLASLDFNGKKLVSEEKVRNASLREGMDSIFSLPVTLREEAGRPDGFVFNDRHAVQALYWELNRLSRLEDHLRTNTSGKALRLGESPWSQPTYQIEDLPMLTTVDAMTDAWNNCVYAEGDKTSDTVVWEW